MVDLDHPSPVFGLCHGKSKSRSRRASSAHDEEGEANVAAAAGPQLAMSMLTSASSRTCPHPPTHARGARQHAAAARTAASSLAPRVRITRASSTSGRPASERTHASSDPADMTESKVAFTNAARQRLVGVLADAGTNNVVILCHGYAGSKDGFVYPQMAKALARARLGSLRFDFSGNGESEGAFEFGNYWAEVGDLRAAVQYVREVVRKKVVAIVGHSKGGNVVLLYASQYDDVPIVVNIAGRFDCKRGVKERFGEETLEKVNRLGEVQMTVKSDSGETVKWLLTKKSLDERLALDMEAAAKKITLSEVLTVHGTADKVIPFQDGEAFSRVIRQHMLWPCEGADHNFRGASHADQLVRKVVEHISSGL